MIHSAAEPEAARASSAAFSAAWVGAASLWFAAGNPGVAGSSTTGASPLISNTTAFEAGAQAPSATRRQKSRLWQVEPTFMLLPVT
jgi:hypothetical protein